MPAGSAPGERRGGRRPGSPNKKTVARVLAAEQEVREARQSGKKLAKDVLEEFMMLFRAMAAHYQPRIDGTAVVQGNEGKFLEYGKLTVDTAAQLAKYQSPQYRAIVITPQPDILPDRRRDGPVSELSPAQAYALMRDGGVIEGKLLPRAKAKKAAGV